MRMSYMDGDTRYRALDEAADLRLYVHHHANEEIWSWGRDRLRMDGKLQSEQHRAGMEMLQAELEYWRGQTEQTVAKLRDMYASLPDSIRKMYKVKL